jgi:cytochrome b561/polyisoprenoid-binding protein YceI
MPVTAWRALAYKIANAHLHRDLEIMMTNTKTSYGGVARFFHWAIALLIVTGFALGIIGDNLPRTAGTVDMLKTLYSVHKTIGVTVFFLALLRILWALSQPRPVPLHPKRKLETLAAEVVHWALYGSLVIVPLSGWIMHAAEVGFANIWWPFGQGLPFVPKSVAVAHAAASVHGTAVFVLLGALVLHIAGAMKHVVIDRDETLARMVKGYHSGDPQYEGHNWLAPIAALIMWAGVIGGALALGGERHDVAQTQLGNAAQTLLISQAPTWHVTDGTLGFGVTQSGAEIDGAFKDWAAQIAYDLNTGTGSVLVKIDTTTLTLGSITSSATGVDFFNTAAFTTAVFEAEIARLDAGPVHEATGTLTLVGQVVPVTLEFTLQTDGRSAKMHGATTLDRRDFGMGKGYTDESTVGFGVDVIVDLTARLAE